MVLIAIAAIAGRSPGPVRATDSEPSATTFVPPPSPPAEAASPLAETSTEPPGVLVPDVGRLKLWKARSAIRALGLKVEVSYRRTSKARAGTVLSQRPRALMDAQPGTVVHLVVAKAPLPPPPPPKPSPKPSPKPTQPLTGSCDPSYVGACLDPNASDYDCLGGSGNGPLYTGRVEVVGDDHFGLDADHDGLGCEDS